DSQRPPRVSKARWRRTDLYMLFLSNAQLRVYFAQGTTSPKYRMVLLLESEPLTTFSGTRASTAKTVPTPDCRNARETFRPPSATRSPGRWLHSRLHTVV